MDLRNFQKSNDLLPNHLLERFGPGLRQRLGDTAFQNRIEIEDEINPATGLTLRRMFIMVVHRFSKVLLWVLLGVIGKRKKAHENCWKTELVLQQSRFTSLKRGQTIRLLHLSDFHLDTNLSQARRWAEIISPLDFDLAVITGDFFNGFSLPTHEKLKALKLVTDSISAPVYGIFGNHDCLLSAPLIEDLGVKLLLNESSILDLPSARVQLTGIDDPHYFKADDLERALGTVTDKKQSVDFKILLAHAPKEPEQYATAGFNLCLCGHTHGGQLCTRKQTPLLRNGTYASDTIAGWWKQENMKGFTSRGTGTGRLTYRLNCPPEIVLHEILPA